MSWLKQLFTRRRRYDELSESIREHLEEKIADLMSRGMTQRDSEQTARREFGNVTLIEERGRAVWQWPTLESALSDVRYALRQLKKSPGFAITVVLTLALGIGANTAIFTLIHDIQLKSLPVGDPKSLYRIGDGVHTDQVGFPDANGDFDVFSFDLYKQLRGSTPEFEQLAAMEAFEDAMNVRRGTAVAKIEQAEFVSGNYFNMFGVGAFAGRVFTEQDDRLGATPVAMMSYQAWQTDYASDPAVVGATFYIQSQPVTVAGILPPGFYGDRISNNPPALWIPLSAEPFLKGTNSILRNADENWLYAMGRLKPGVAVGPLQEKISANLRQWLATQEAYTSDGGATRIAKQHVVLMPAGSGIQNLQQRTNTELNLLLTISCVVLLVACANVANLLLARGTKRKTEISMRMALGAARSRVIRQMLTESVVLGCLGGVAGLAFAYAGTRMILALTFPDSPHSVIHAIPSLPVLGFAFLLSLITGIVFGSGPAWITSHSDPAKVLRGVTRSAVDSASVPQRSLLVFQAALSLVLLAGAGLLIKSLRNMEHQDFGMQTANRYVLHLDPSGAGYKPEQLQVLNQALEQQFAAIPGIQSVGLAVYSPLDGYGDGLTFPVTFPGRPAPGARNIAFINRVSSDYFATVGQPILRGRAFTDNDTDTSQFVAIVNQAFAKKFFPGADAIGRNFGDFGQGAAKTFEIVGVVADTKYTSPRDDAQPMYFRPLSQWQHGLDNATAASAETGSHYINAIVLRFQREPENLDAGVRRALDNVSPNLTITNLHSLDYQVMGNFNQERLVARLTALFGLLTLVLTSIGLYGITSYQVTQRTREVGLRIALGASRGSVMVWVMRGAFLPVAVGLALGIPVALIGVRYVAFQLYAVRPYDPVSLFGAVCVLSGAALIAGFLPARRAASVDAMQALRME